MKHTLRCHGFGDAGQAARAGPATGMNRAGSRDTRKRMDAGPAQPTAVLTELGLARLTQ